MHVNVKQFHLAEAGWSEGESFPFTRRHLTPPASFLLECITDKQANPGVIVNCQFMTCGTGAGAASGRKRGKDFSNFAPCARFDALIRVSSF